MGRSGSTLVYEAICDGMRAARFGGDSKFGAGVVADHAWDLARKRLRNGVVYKTHALAEEMRAGHGEKIVFLFGLASDAAGSVISCRQRYGREWVDEHFLHMRANGTFEELSERDVLRFAEQLEGWLGLEGVDLLAIRYEALWEKVDELSNFLGFRIVLPPRKDRQSTSATDPSLSEKLGNTYRDLDNAILKLPDSHRVHR